MAFIELGDRIVTGFDEVDNQHKRLISILNELYVAMKSGKSEEIIDKILNELHSYTIYHFSTEERYMKKYGYPKFVEHKGQHDNFAARIKDFMKRRARGEATLSIELMNFLKDWLINHIITKDKEMCAFFLQKMGDTEKGKAS